MVDVSNREVRTAREVAREIGALIDALENDALEKVVIVQQGRMRAVLLSVEQYEAIKGQSGSTS
jgi:PHD/YefM family antitoxin component YafN of YafNO toxin-antitoxin module